MTCHRPTSSLSTTLRRLAIIVAALVGLTALPATALPSGPRPAAPIGPGGIGLGNELDLPPHDPIPPIADRLIVRPPGLRQPDSTDSVPRGTALLVTLVSDDRNDAEGLERRTPTGWVTVLAKAPRSGNVVHRDTNIEPDARHCYRTTATRGDDVATSRQVCTRTTTATAQPVLRLQVGIDIADRKHAGTGNGKVSVSLGQGQATWLDRPGTDFRRDTRAEFDVFPVAEMGDISQILLRNTSKNDMCIESFDLQVNEAVVFERVYGHTDCLWLGRDYQTSVRVGADELRAASTWTYSNPAGRIVADTVAHAHRHPDADAVLHLPADEVRSRLESGLGTALHGTGLYWKGKHSLGLQQHDTEQLDVDIKVKYDVNNWFDPTIRLRAGLHLEGDYDADGLPTLAVDARDVRVDLDVDPILDIIAEVFQCRLIWALVTDDDFKSCAAQVSEEITDAVSARNLSAAITIAELGPFEIAGFDVVVNDDTSIDVLVRFGSPPGPTSPGPIPAGATSDGLSAVDSGGVQFGADLLELRRR